MSKAVLQGNASGTGVVTLQTPDTNTDMTITLPARASNLMADGPAFGAYQSSAQSLSAGTFTKITFQTEEFDTANCFDSTTNYRFTPNVAGYYQINARFRVSTAIANAGLAIYKNGSAFKDGVFVDSSSVGLQINSLIYLNGSTDYIEIWGYFSNTQNTTGAQVATWVNGFLARGA